MTSPTPATADRIAASLEAKVRASLASYERDNLPIGYTDVGQMLFHALANAAIYQNAADQPIVAALKHDPSSVFLAAKNLEHRLWSEREDRR